MSSPSPLSNTALVCYPGQREIETFSSKSALVTTGKGGLAEGSRELWDWWGGVVVRFAHPKEAMR